MKTSKLYDVSDINMMADHLGTMRAEIKELQDVAKGMEALIKASGKPELFGDLFKVSVVESERKTVNWKAIAEKLGASNQMIAGNTKTSEVVAVRVSAHTKKAGS